MSCNHRYGRGYWHDCDGPLPPPEWYDSYGYGYPYRPRRYRDDLVVLRDDYDEEEGPRRRGAGRGRFRRDERVGAEAASPVSLQERAAALREELARIEDELGALPAEPGPRPVD